MEITALDRKKIGELKKYSQPKCPGCGAKMNLTVGKSGTRENYYDAWYYCDNDRCLAGWSTRPKSHINAYQAAFMAYQATTQRKGETYEN